jgi:hypothetical protein
LPMMTGTGPFGGIEMGGMFTTLKVRAGQARNDYKDPGWYRHPPGTVASEWTGATPAVTTPPQSAPTGTAAMTVKRGGAHSGH